MLLVLVLASGVYFWKTKMQKLVTNDDSLTEGTQDANPYSATNPYSDIKVNPFE